MKAFDRIIAAVIVFIILLVAGFNIIMRSDSRSGGRQYRVDAARAAAVIEAGETPDPGDYPSLTSIAKIDDFDVLPGTDSDYLVLKAGGDFYLFEYDNNVSGSSTVKAANIALLVIAAAVIITLIAVRNAVIKPFTQLRDLPYELSKGKLGGATLSAPLKESRHKLFGRFVWGLNMLRDKLEQSEKRELSLRAENKKQIISLSHDIKIPLSAIKLYAKALEKGIYDRDDQTDAAAKINRHADEIELYVSEIVTASCDDIVSFDVAGGEFYLSVPIGKIDNYYKDALKPRGTEFVVYKYNDCLLRGDPDRAAEVMENIIENAIKYGDGVGIHISFSDEEDCRLVSVSNSGCTLPQDEMPHIFDSFYRGSNAAGKDGSGLGLYICRVIMRRMNGDIFAKSENGVMTVTAVFRKA